MLLPIRFVSASIQLLSAPSGWIQKSKKPSVEQGNILFVVEDTGIGVPTEEAEHIFEEFVQLDEYYNGTGIGLTVARSLVRRIGGDIKIDTSYKAGARFVMQLPMD